ncbi:MAG: Chemotaxis protein CheY [Firmicutes bacterium ADurb.Bin419]|nr:MAG: Chemotaxis protein CheY [Firmicutes bacterium ADurb.Bin419]
MASILIVDDSSMARRNLRNILISAGHTVLAEATNGVQAFVEFENHKPDLVTMDITMPILSGIDGVKKILSSYPDAKIIMVSALNQKLMILEALQTGAKHYIVKPFSYEKVIDVVDEVLQLTCSVTKTDSNNMIAQKQKTTQPSMSQSKPESTILRPFFIETKDGISVINITKSMCEKNIAALKLGVQRISSIKPIKVVFNFGDVESIEEGTFNRITEIFNSIIDLEGACIMVSSNQNFVMNISAKNDAMPIRLYTGKLNTADLNI